jgi:hypothetical protein
VSNNVNVYTQIYTNGGASSKFVVQKKVGIRRKKPGGNSAEDETVQRGYYFSQ